MVGLKLPGKNVYITEGTVVTLASFPGTTWIVHNGTYTYMGRKTQGWYLLSVPAKQLVPITESELYIIDVVGQSDSNCGCGCGGGSSSGGSGGGSSGLYPETGIDLYDEVDRAFITVETIQDRNALNSRFLPHGKVVKVNNGGDPQYYYWDGNTNEWKEETFGIPLDDFLTRVDARKYFLKKDEAEQKFVSHDTWKQTLDEEIKNINDKIDEELSKLLEQAKQVAKEAAESLAEQKAEDVLQSHIESGEFLTQSEGDDRYLRKEDAVIETFDFIDGGRASDYLPELMSKRSGKLEFVKE